MHIILDRRRLERVFPVVRDRGPAAKKAPFLRLDAHQGELAISGLAVEAVIPAVVEEPGVLFIQATLLRSLLKGFARETSLDCRVTEEAFMVGNLRLPMNPQSLVYFPDRAKAPRILPGAERLKVRYGAVVERRRNKGARAGARAREGKDKAATPLFDLQITQGFELRPPSRLVTRRIGFAPARKAEAAPPPALAPAAPAAREAPEPPAIADFDRDQLKAALLAVVGTEWIERDAAIRAAACRLGFERCGKRVRAAIASAITGLLRQGRLRYDGSMICLSP
jgi:hypothetical protein